MNIYRIEDDVYYFPIYQKLIKTNKNYKDLEDFCINNTWIEEKYPDISRENIKYLKYEKCYPSSGGIYLTNKCPMRCTYCFYESGNKDRESLTKNQILNYIKYLVKNAVMMKRMMKLENNISVLTISGGGEPTADFELLKYCVEIHKDLCNKHGVSSHIHLVTNGVLSKHKIDYIVNNIDSLNISFDGDPETQNKNRPLINNKNSFDIVDNTLKEFDRHNYPYLIRSTVSEDSYGKLKEIADFLFNKYKCIREWHLEPIFKCGRGIDLCSNDNSKFYIYVAELYDYVKKVYPERSIYNTLYTYRVTDTFCRTVTGTNVWLDAHGDLLICTEKIDKKKYRLGYINDREVVSVENEHDHIFDYYLKYRNQYCTKCHAFYQCAGGCPMTMNRNEDGKFKDELSQLICNSIKTFWKHAFVELIDKKEYIDMYISNEYEDENNKCVIYDISSIREEKDGVHDDR